MKTRRVRGLSAGFARLQKRAVVYPRAKIFLFLFLPLSLPRRVTIAERGLIFMGARAVRTMRAPGAAVRELKALQVVDNEMVMRRA